ncbi:MAG: hypothetical protein ACK5PZ_19665, partial [Pirellula sp.]
PWTMLHPANRTAWLDQLAGWEPSHSLATSPEMPRPTHKSHSLCILITSSRRWNQHDPKAIDESTPSSFVLSVDDNHATLSTPSDWSSEHPKTWTISIGDGFEESLRNVWREVCQASLAHGATCAS